MVKKYKNKKKLGISLVLLTKKEFESLLTLELDYDIKRIKWKPNLSK